MEYPQVELYGDEEGTVPVKMGHGVILRSVSPGRLVSSYQIFPTTLGHFETGKAITWEWDMSRVWGPTWYRDPSDNAIKKAWEGSAEFVGRNLEDVLG